ncbi:uncharacterized protein LOC111700477 isoform X2 [Eurytemora carolleeae]|nr:uncharacterized protein LOC111700477 isoform X2 [Eurytemora carolleeae]|eukprot:XP_023327167.1 uncharacterized protein LOC111700477 isoform X2 [Eurytemora affinis]
MDQFAELTNTIFDAGMVGKEEMMSPSTMFLSLMVAMIPKLVPRIMPSLISRMNPEAGLSRFNDPTYLLELENSFRDKFAENLRMVVDILEEEQNGGIEKKERSGEEGRLATLITSTLDTINVDISDFDGSKMIDLADLVSGQGPRAAVYNVMAEALIGVFSTISSFFFY